MRIVEYSADKAVQWDDFVESSRNGTFLFKRPYMDYHQDRFVDASLLFYDEKDLLIGVLPANVRADEALIQSHGGLTYGGLVLSHRCQLLDVRDMMLLAAKHYLQRGLRMWQYKPVPYIYHRYPSDEYAYWLFRSEAVLQSRAVSSAISLRSSEHTKLWHRKIKHKACEQLMLHEDCMEHLSAFWKIVNEVLQSRHQAKPVHSVAEIALLHERFPENVKFFSVTNEDGDVITGIVLFVTDEVVHVQYMEAGEEARRRRALDWLMQKLIPRYEKAGKHYFEFGISTEQGGAYLNEGLAYQKEGFGGRGVCYDSYLVDFQKMIDRLTK